MITLRKALKDGKLKQFIREHEKDAPGDMDKLDSALKRPASEKSKAAPKSSSREQSDD
jgi:hypothetical protein